MEYNLSDHIQGDTMYELPFVLNENSAPKDLTGCEINMSIKLQKTSDVANHTLTTVDSTIEITDATAGKFQLKRQIINFDEGHYYYDMTFKFPNAEVFTWLIGRWKIVKALDNG